MNKTIDIVKIINDDSKIFESDDKITQKLQENFTSEEEKLFLGSFERYRHYDDLLDYVV